MTREIDLSLLRAFVAVSETGGMTAAGRHLNLTQAAVSQQIKRLEELFDKKLFDRTHRLLTSTPSGEKLLPHAERILSLNDDIWGRMTSSALEGQVRIGVPHDIIDAFMPPILRGFSKAWPGVEISLECTYSSILIHALENGKLDLVLTTEDKPNDRSQLLLSDQLVWVGAIGGSIHERTPLPVTLGDENCGYRAVALKGLSEMGRDWRYASASSDLTAFFGTLEADLAIGPLLSQTVPEGFEILDTGSGLPSLPTFHINLYVAPTAPSAIALELEKHITKSFASRYPKAA